VIDSTTAMLGKGSSSFCVKTGGMVITQPLQMVKRKMPLWLLECLSEEEWRQSAGCGQNHALRPHHPRDGPDAQVGTGRPRKL